MDSAQKVVAVSRAKREKPEHPAPVIVPVLLEEEPRAILFRFRLRDRPIGIPVKSLDAKNEPSEDEKMGTICLDAENAAVSISMADAMGLGLVLSNAYVKLAPMGTGFCYVYLWYERVERFNSTEARATAEALAEKFSAITWRYIRAWLNPGDMISVNLIGKMDGHPVQNKIVIERKD